MYSYVCGRLRWCCSGFGFMLRGIVLWFVLWLRGVAMYVGLRSVGLCDFVVWYDEHVEWHFLHGYVLVG